MDSPHQRFALALLQLASLWRKERKKAKSDE